MFKFLVRAVISTAIIIFLSTEVDWISLQSAFIKISVADYLLSTAFAISSSVVIAYKDKFLLWETIFALPFKRLLSIHFISRFYALLLPTALGAEVFRWYKVTKGHEGKGLFVSITIFERILFLLVIIAFSLVPLFIRVSNSQIIEFRDKLAPVLVLVSLGLFCALFILLNQQNFTRIGTLFKGRLADFVRTKTRPFLSGFQTKIVTVALSVKVLLIIFVWQVLFILRVYFLIKSVGSQIDLLDSTWIGSSVMLLQVLPISFAGIGIREGAYGYLFNLLGSTTEQGLITGTLFFSQMLIYSFIGGIITVVEK